MKYLMIDFNSIHHQFQFRYEEQYVKFIDLIIELIKENGEYDKIYIYYTTNAHILRQKQYLDLGFDYVIENSFTNDTINLFKSNLLSCHPDSSKLPLKFIQFIGCEMKDAIFSSIYHMKNFCEQKSLKLQINVLTTNRLLSLLNLKFPNNDVFRLQYLKYNQSKSFVGIEKTTNTEKFIENYYGLENHATFEFKKDLYHYFETIITQQQVLSGINWTVNKIKLIERFGEKKANNLLNQYVSLNHFLSGYDDIVCNEKKYLNKELLKKMINLANINRINYQLDKNVLFQALKTETEANYS